MTMRSCRSCGRFCLSMTGEWHSISVSATSRGGKGKEGRRFSTEQSTYELQANVGFDERVARGEDVVRAGNRHTLCSPGSRGPRALAAAGIFSYCLRRQRRGGRPSRSAPRRSLPGTAPTGALVAIACRAGRVPSGSGRAFCRGHVTRKRGSGPAGKRAALTVPTCRRARGRAGTMGPCASPGPNPGNRSN